MITKLFFSNDENLYTSEIGTTSNLSNLNKINIFVGANNSGKSRLLRTIFLNKDFQCEESDFKAIELSELLNDLHNEIASYLNTTNYEDLSSHNIPALKQAILSKINVLKQVKTLSIVTIATDTRSFWSWLLNFKAMGGPHKAGAISLTVPSDLLTEKIKKIISNYSERVEKLLVENFEYKLERIYIPLLRGLRPIQQASSDYFQFEEKNDNYSIRTIRDYFKEKGVEQQEIFTGQTLYTDIRKMLLGKQKEREKIRAFEKFLGDAFFNGDPITLIPNESDDSIHVSIGMNERAIYEIGDGIQALIILLYPVFINMGKRVTFFIEEPELSLHPGFQRLFIETLMRDEFKMFQFFITTHSNHFLDITLDHDNISIYSFQKVSNRQQFLIENTSSQNLQTLNLLGVRNSSVFLSNCTVWVEGITDRLYLKKYMEVYIKSLSLEKRKMIFLEDYHFSFVEYGGNNIVHWAFGEEASYEQIKASKIASRIFLISDKDSTESNIDSEKAKRLTRLKEILKNNFAIIDGREIENTLSPKVLIKTLQGFAKNNASVSFDEKLITFDSYQSEPLGKYIEDHFTGLKKFKADSGTIFYKMDFCNAAIANIKTVDDLSLPALTLVENIYNFIQEHN